MRLVYSCREEEPMGEEEPTSRLSCRICFQLGVCVCVRV